MDAAPDGIEPLSRFGRDLLVVWDGNDPNSDIVLKAAISVARMIAVQERRIADEASADITELRVAIESVCREVNNLDEIAKWASSAEGNCEKIVSKANSMKKRINSLIESLREHVQGLSSTLSDTPIGIE